MKIKWFGGLMVLILIMNGRLARAQDDTGGVERMLQKYTLAESLEFGVEPAYQMGGDSSLIDVRKLYLTFAHTMNENTTIKLNFGYLDYGYEVNKQDIGTSQQFAFLTTLIRAYSMTNLKPYWGFGISFYHYGGFDASLPAYEGITLNYRANLGSSFPSELLEDIFDMAGLDYMTFGYNVVAGVKYLRSGLSISLCAYKEWIRDFTILNNLDVDLSNWSVGLNLALRF